MPNDVPPYSVETDFPCTKTPMSGGVDIGYSLFLDCVNDIHTTRIRINGGTPPYIVTANKGQLINIDIHTWEVRIDKDVTSLFGVFAGYNSANCEALIDIPGGLSPGDPGYDIETMSTHGGGHAFARLGLHLTNKGIFADCRHHCSAMVYDCLGRASGNPIIGTNTFILDPNACPNSEDLSGIAHSPGRGLGPCVNTHDYDLASRYPGAVFITNLAPPCTADPDYAACSEGSKPCGGIDTTPTNVANWEAAQPNVLDIRHENLIKKGCSPCELDQDTDIIVTITDSEGSTIIIIIHIQ